MQFKVVFALAFATLAAAKVPAPNTTPSTNPPSNIPPPKIPPPKFPPQNITDPKIPPPKVPPPKVIRRNTPSPNTPSPKSPNTPSTNIPSPKIIPPFPGNPPPTVGAKKCDAEKLQCCKSTHSPDAPEVSSKLGPLGISAASISGLVGLTCTKITGNTCSDKPVCCTDNSFDGVVSLSCNPVNLSM